MEHLSLLSIALFVFCGLVTGFLSGFFGIGGGVIMTPTLIYVLSMFKLSPAVTFKQVVATSMAIISVSSIISARKHLQNKNFDIKIFKKWAIFVAIGVVIGFLLYPLVTPAFISLIFIIQMIFIVLNMFIKYDYKLGNINDAGLITHRIIPMIIGLICSWVGVGGAVFMITVFTMYSIPLLTAIGTATALNVIISVTSTIIAIFAGLNVDGRFAYSLGYVNSIVVLCMLPFVVLMVPLGVKISLKFSEKKLRLLFAIMMLIILAVMIRNFIVHF